jgi:hypothetical protein
MNVLTLVALILTAWCALAVIVAGLFSVAMRGMAGNPPPQPAGTPAFADALADAA